MLRGMIVGEAVVALATPEYLAERVIQNGHPGQNASAFVVVKKISNEHPQPCRDDLRLTLSVWHLERKLKMVGFTARARGIAGPRKLRTDPLKPLATAFVGVFVRWVCPRSLAQIVVSTCLCWQRDYHPEEKDYLFLMRLDVAVCVNGGLPPIPVTVKRYVPGSVEDFTDIVSVEEPVAGFGLKPPVAPAGSPFTDKLTGELNPRAGRIVTV